MQTGVSTLSSDLRGQSKEIRICQELIFQVDTMSNREYKEHVFLSSMHCTVLCFVSFDHVFYMVRLILLSTDLLIICLVRHAYVRTELLSIGYARPRQLRVS